MEGLSLYAFPSYTEGKTRGREAEPSIAIKPLRTPGVSNIQAGRFKFPFPSRALRRFGDGFSGKEVWFDTLSTDIAIAYLCNNVKLFPRSMHDIIPLS